MNTELYELRLKKVEQVMIDQGIGCLLLNQSQTIEYLTGAKNTCSWLFLTQNGCRIALVLESDYRVYREQSVILDIRTFIPHDPLNLFQKIPAELGLGERSIAVEKDHLRYSQYEMLEKCIGDRINPQFNADHLVQEARLTKTKAEIEAIHTASQLASFGIKLARKIACVGMTEAQLAHDVREAMLKEGAGGDTYIYLASDERSSLAHTVPTNNVIQSGPVVIDIHSSYHGFHSDMARTLFFDHPSKESIQMYQTFREKTLRTIQGLKDGINLVDVKRMFYQDLKENPDWILLTGPLLHGIGIVNYELPKFDHPFEGKGYPEHLSAGMALACTNLGLYSKQGWGIRYEDTLVLHQDGVEILTQDPLDNMVFSGES